MPTLIERRTVSRKTPRDGKLEISRGAAEVLSPIQPALRVSVRGDEAPARIDRMTCSCGGANNPHDHYFVESAPLRTLQAGVEVDLTLEQATGTLVVSEAS
jgi:hypothetical protein